MKKKFPQIFKILLLFCFISMNAQTINYDPPGFYVRGQPISTLVPNQSGITIQGGTYRDVSLFAGTGSSGGTNASSSSTSSFQNPRGIVKDRSGNYYIAEVQGKRIRKISATGVVTTVHQFTDFEPRDLVINSNNGDLYAVIHTHRIIRIPNTNWANYPLQEPTYVYTSDAVNVIAGSVSSGYTDATGTAARFNNPWGLAIASDNTYLLVSDFGNNRIRKVMLSNFAVSTFVPSATFSGPTDVHIVNNDLIYVAEFNGNRIQKISGGSSVSLFVSGTFGGGNFDGTGATGFIDQPHSLTADGMGNVYVVERMNHKVRKITPQGKITTIAGTLWNTDNSGNQIGTGSNARFRFPTGIFYDIEGGFLLIADTDNHQLKKVQLSGFEVLPPLPTGLSLNTSTGVISGTPTAVSLQNVYQNNFNTSQLQFLAGETVTLADNAAVIGDYLQLTPRQNNSKGGITIQPFESNGFGALKVSFDLITTKTSADNTSADGFSYSFAPDASATATSPQAEIGTGTKLAVSFATFGSNRGIRIFYNPASNQSLGTTLNSVLLAYTNNTSWMGKSVKVVLDVTDMGDLTLTIDGVTIFTTTLPANFSNSDKSTWKHVFKARTGLSNDLHAIDNLSLQLRNGPTRHTVVGRDYNNEVESTFLINSSVLPTVSTQSVTSIQYTQATVNYQILGPGSSSLSNSGFVWSTTPSPTIFDNAVIHPSPAVVGNQSLAFDDLLSSTTYYVRAVVINEWGVYAYGQELSFTTLAYTAPTVSTNGTTAVTQTTAVSGGDVTNDGGNTLVERGICWSTNPNPTIADQKIVDSAPSVGTFTSSITGLVAGTVYYIRAYATNSVGTTYGSEQSFMTIPTVPIITYQEENYLAQNFLGSPIVPTITGGSVTQGLSGVSTIVTSFPSNSSKQFALSHDNNFFYYASINTIYKINRATNVTTILAGGTTGSNDGIGTAAQFEVAIGMGFSSIAVNKTTGNIYVLSGNEQQSARLRQITPDGVVSTIANIIDGSLGYPNGPTAVDGMGNIFYINNGKAIGKIPCINNSASPTFGTPIPNWAGTMFSQLNVDGTGDSARFRQITSKIAIDASNNLYVVDLRLIRKISPTAVVTTIAGNLNSTTGANGLSIDGNGTSAYFTNYASYTYSPLDNSLYGIDMGTSHFIRKIDLSTLNVTTLYQTNVFSGAGFTMEMLNGDLYGILYGGEAISKTTVFGYSVSPSLPAGLSLTVTGEITGTPTVLSPLTTYTIKSINPYHIVNATTKIVVEPFTTSSPITSDQTFCSGALVSDLLATGTYLQWYTALTGGIAIPTTTALATGTYYLEQIIAASVVDIGSDFNFPSGVAIQADGKIVIVDSGNNTIKRMNADGSNIETLGSGFSSPKDVVIQADGKIVIVDTGNDAIKRMNADGTNIETLGTGFASPYGVAIQADGKIVVADSNNNAIKRMNADGTNVETLGSGFSNPTGVAIQADGKIVVADAANNAINRMNSDGTNIETLGSGFSLPTGVAIQADGKIVVADADNSAIKRMNVDGTNIETLGNGFSFPYAVAIQSDGKIVVVDLLDHTIKRITEASSNRVPVNVTVNNTEAPTASAQSFSTSGTVSDLVAIGTALQWYAASTGGTALPTTTALETGTYYVSQTIAGCESLRTAVAVTVNVTTAPIASAQTFCTSGTVADLVATGTDLQWYTSLTGGTAIPTTTALATGTYYVEQSTAASVVTLGSSFNFPSGAAIQADGKIVVADQGNNAIKRMNVDGTNIETLGSGFNSPYGVAIQSDGKIVVADKGNNAIKRMNADGSNIETLGTGFASPYGVTIQADGKIVVADSQNNAIKRMNADGSNIVTLGSGFSFPFGVAIQADGKIVVSVPFNNAIKRMDADGTNVETLGSGFSFPSGVAIQADGKIVLADQGNMAIKRMNVDGTNIETLGTGFSFPYGVAIQGDGKIVVADFNNNAIKRITEASSTNRVPVNVTVNNTEAPTASAQSFSTSGTVSDLVAIGTALQWYAASTGSTALPTTTALSSGMYYVSQTLNSCESPRTAVAVTVNVTTAPTASDQILCQGATVSDLVAVGTTLQWYTVAEGGVALGTTTILSTGTYYVSQTVSGVESDRTAVTVTIVPSLGNISWISGPSVLSAESTVATYSVTAVSGATS
ncbi:virginiamycin B lyase family protein, partial [Flavobacterium lacus]